MKWYYYVLTAMYCGLIFYLSSQPELPRTGIEIPYFDKLAHMIAFGGLAGLVSIGIRSSNESVPPRVQWLVPIAVAALYGVTDEIHQTFVPMRTFDLWDLAADGLGAILVQAVLCGAWWRVPIRHETISRSMV